MKLHEFVCQDCGQEFEELVQNCSETTCPRCNSKNTRKLLSAVKTNPAGASTGGEASACAPSSGFS